MTLPTGNNPIRNVESRPSRAFTLIELILVMAMLLVVFAMSAPSLANFFRGRTLDSEARRLLSLIRYGQSRAASEGVPVELWLDVKQGAYGLQQEASYTDVDAKAVELPLGKDLRLEVEQGTPQFGALGQTRPAGRDLPRIRFLPDGFIGPTSPESVSIRESRGEVIRLAQSRNRLTYEIETNVLAHTHR